MLDCVATKVDDRSDDGRFGPMGKQRRKDTGVLTRKRMETEDEEFGARTQDFIRRAVKDGQPFFAWHNPSRMHVYMHLTPASRLLAAPYSSPLDIYGSGMMEHDGHVGELLNLLD